MNNLNLEQTFKHSHNEIQYLTNVKYFCIMLLK